MSFSKARLRRFNEEIPQVPSPGRYDPKLDCSVKGAIMPTSKRFPGQQTTSSSLDNIDKSSTASGVVFRTPQLLRKVALTPRMQHLKEKNMDTSSSDILSSDERPYITKATFKQAVSKADYKRLENELHSLTDKYHKMLLDKELEVSSLKEEIEEIKTNETKLKEVLEEKIKLASDRHTETLQLKDNLDTIVEKINVDREEHQRLINNLKSEISVLQNKKYELETVLAEKQSVTVTINDKCSDLEHELKSLGEEIETLQQANTCISIGADEKFKEFETTMSSKLQTLEESFEFKIRENEQSFQSKINSFCHEFNLKSKERIDELKQTQKGVEELERMINNKIKEFSKSIREADERCKCLYRELCKVEEQRDELVVSDLEKKLAMIDIEAKSASYQSELEECKNTCRKYKITLKTMTDTTTALSNRLRESEEEVERLNSVEKDLEQQKHLLEEKSELLLSDIVALRGSMDKMEESIIRDVFALKEDLNAKVDLFKEEAMKTEDALKKKINEKQYAIDLLLKENEYFKTEIERKDEFIEDIKNKEKHYERNIEKLKTERLKLEEELSEKLSAQKNLHTILNNKFESANTLICDLRHLKSQNESQINSLMKQIKELKEVSVSLERINLEQASKIQSLQLDTERKKEVETKQKQYIDELISDVVLEKERCEALEVEKERLKALLRDAEQSIQEKTEETEKLSSSVEALQKSRETVDAEKENLEAMLLNAERNVEEKTEEIQKLVSKVEAVKKTSEDFKEQLRSLENEKEILKHKLNVAENNLKQLKLTDSNDLAELQDKIIELKSQLSSAKEVIKTEIPKLERDNINKVENILELNLNIDSLRDEIEHHKTNISCLEAEKDGLLNLIEEMQSQIRDSENVIQGKNLSISALNEELKRKDEFCQDLLSQFDTMSSEYKKHNEVLKHNSELNTQLIEMNEKNLHLELQLSEKDKELDLLKERVDSLRPYNEMKDELFELRHKYETVVQHRDQLSREIGELMGHQNNRQKIKKLIDYKQQNIELKDNYELLALENVKLKTKIENLKKQSENKENVSVTFREDKAKSKPGSAKKKPMSPSVLKSSNF